MRKSFFRAWGCWWMPMVLGTLFCMLFECPVVAQTVPASAIQITHPRPVLKAVEDLIARYGYVITYEEPRIVYAGDMKDITQQRRAKGKVIPRRVLALAGGNVRLTLPSTMQVSAQQLDGLLQQLVQSWTDSNQGGAHFQVEKDGSVFHILPTEVRDQNGNWQSAKSILETPISLATEPRSDLDTFKAIASAIGAAADVRVISVVNGGVMFGGELDTRQYAIGAQDEPAASVLMRALNAVGTRRTWFLLYDPTMRAYVLNIDDVQSTPPTTAPPPSAPKVPSAPPAQAPGAPPSCLTCSGVRPPSGT